MRQIFFIVPFVVLGLNLGFSKSLWWQMCSQHWNECKSLYLKWYETKVSFDKKEIECVKNAKGVRDMNLCLWNIKRERKKAFQQWRREFGYKYRQWIRESKTSSNGKQTMNVKQSATEQETNKTAEK